MPGCLRCKSTACYLAGTLLALLLAAAPSLRALDFQLRTTTVQEDGFRREQLYFQNDAQTRVVIALPGGWTRADAPNFLAVTPPNATNAMVKLERSNLGPGVLFQSPGLEVYRKRVVAEIPPGATEVKPGAEAADPLPVFGWKSCEFTVDYEFFGQSYRRSILFLNLNPKEQVMLTTVALKQDYERIHAAGLDVLRSWQVMPALQ